MAMNKWCSTVIAMLRHAFLASLNVLYLVVSYYCVFLYVHCTVCFPLHLSGYFIIVLDSPCHYGTVVFCSLISHMGMHDITTECVRGNVAQQCLF